MHGGCQSQSSVHHHRCLPISFCCTCSCIQWDQTTTRVPNGLAWTGCGLQLVVLLVVVVVARHMRGPSSICRGPGPKPNIGVRNLTCGVLLLLLAHTSDAGSHTGPPAVFISPPQKTKRGGNHLHERLVGSSCMLCHHRTDIIL